MAKQPTQTLTPKQQIFCDEYLIDFNATRSAIAAGYSKKTAQKIGSENISKPLIQDYLNKKREALSKKHDVTMDRIIQEYSYIAFQDSSHLFDGSRLMEISELPEEVTRSISEVSAQRVRGAEGESVAEIVKIKQHDKKWALDSLTKILGGFEKDNDQKKVEAIVHITRNIVKAK